MPRRSSAAEKPAVSWSSSQIRPEVGSIIRLIIRSDVVLPQPDGPTNTVIWPDGATTSQLVHGDGAVRVLLGNRLEPDHPVATSTWS